jgi:hypothetical protein
MNDILISSQPFHYKVLMRQHVPYNYNEELITMEWIFFNLPDSQPITEFGKPANQDQLNFILLVSLLH